MKRRFPDHRIKLAKDRVHHLKEPMGRCFVCGAPAFHRVVETPGPMPAIFTLDLCTFHFTRMFKMPANRFPKKVKSKAMKQALVALAKAQPPMYSLRRHMDIPLVIVGERLVSHHFSTPNFQFFLALYRTVSGRMLVSCARVYSKEIAYNLVEEVDKLDFIEATKRLLHGQGQCFEISEYDMPRITTETTKFFEKCAQYADIL